MNTTLSLLSWIEKQEENALKNLLKWSSLNSWSENLSGLAKMEKTIFSLFKNLKSNSTVEKLPDWNRLNEKGIPFKTPLGNTLIFSKREHLKKKVLFGGHMDTVFPTFSHFQTPRIEKDHIIGPGVADMKGGLLVLYLALMAFEKSPFKENIGWDVVISSDEELGSPGSKEIWKRKAKDASIGLIFEPSFSDGALVSERKGSDNYILIAKGVAAHAGRDFHLGKNAIKAISHFVHALYKEVEPLKNITVNVGSITGGGPTNVVPDLASLKLNARSFSKEALSSLHELMKTLALKIEEEEGVKLTLSLEKTTPPKPFDSKTLTLYNSIEGTAKRLDTPLSLRESGGVSDGNLTASVGLATIDTLGVIGGNLHTDKEYMVIKSLTERAKLVFLFLTEFASEP